ncbi:nicotinate-nucleotide--dimethylbenzimidazole phosphoribosyltransferase [Christensenella tenuis]|uniref:Nicotinate-nucleotide--dimethylbenzimidazole phosphoribosyltransferase n=1 Tax=Christensenella tenuis TaxID=2763033 RepID=A0ABR7EHD3_9FIRM|nr:nicotinate-nucleotide--dimethylbenzimidazole phosphoribosyltransferase [Christensenella tenuis]MBC5649175.1 nicotinate-nucleotide--dimethylbenzimidazole phosphoribosyltransferase [Christensenella tenuis]
MGLNSYLEKITLPDENARKLSHKRWNSIAKPLGSLGLLEEAVEKIAAIQGSADIRLERKYVVPMCADNGVVAQGVSQSDQTVTAAVTDNFVKGMTSVCCMAKKIGAEIVPVDIGVRYPLTEQGILNRKIMRGTHDITKGPAMSREQAERAVMTGIEVVGLLKKQGADIIATGEMGIGNTTTSAAVGAVLLGKKAREVTGIGAGLDEKRFQKKTEAIRQAIELNRPDQNDPVGLLSKLGGLDIGGMTGLYIGGAIYHIPIVIDGMISAVAALLAIKICDKTREYMIASHISREPLGKALLKEIGLEAMIDAGMCLGEGTGAVCAMGMIDMALAVYREMGTFSELEIEEYIDYKAERDRVRQERGGVPGRA